MIKSTIDLSVCEDCITYIANGDENSPHVAARVDCWWPSDSGWTLVAGSSTEDEDDDGTEFSWQQCEGCGSTLGGARYPAVAIQE